MQKICFFVRDMDLGGIGRAVSLVSESLSAYDDVDVHLLVYRYDEVANSKGADFLYQENTSITHSLLKRHMASKMRHYIKENEYDVFIACSAFLFLPAILATKGTKTKLVCWEHTSHLATGEVRLQKEMRILGAKMADANVVLTESSKKWYDNKFPNKKNVRIYNPIDPALASRYEQIEYDVESKTLITVGRCAYQKNMENLIEVAAKVLKQKPEWKWEVYGEGDTLEDLRERAVKEVPDGRLSFKGQVPDIYDIYPKCSIYVMTSRWEGFPMVLLEAAANHLPLISYDIETGPSEIIREGENGLLVPPEDINTMAEEIMYLMEKPDTRKNMAESNKWLLEELSSDKIAAQWKTLLDTFNKEKI